MNFQSTKTLTVVAAVAILASTLTASLAQARVQGEVRSETVRFDDLNLASPAGVQALYLRIRTAARDVCGPSEITGERAASAAWKDCVNASVNQAVRKVDHPLLSAYYSERLRASAFRNSG